MTADVIILAPKELHPLIEIALTESGCSTIEQYAEKRGIDAAAKLAVSSRRLSSPSKEWVPPWCERERDVCGIARYHWWIDTLSFFEEMTGIDYHELAHHWDEILDFVTQFAAESMKY